MTEEKTKDKVLTKGNNPMNCLICNLEEIHNFQIEESQREVVVVTRCARCNTEIVHPFVPIIRKFLEK